MTDHPAYDGAMDALKNAKENNLRFLAFIDEGDDKFTAAALCSPRDLASYLNRLLQNEDFAKVILTESAKFAAEQILHDFIPNLPYDERDL